MAVSKQTSSCLRSVVNACRFPRGSYPTVPTRPERDSTSVWHRNCSKWSSSQQGVHKLKKWQRTQPPQNPTLPCGCSTSSETYGGTSAVSVATHSSWTKPTTATGTWSTGQVSYTATQSSRDHQPQRGLSTTRTLSGKGTGRRTIRWPSWTDCLPNRARNPHTKNNVTAVTERPAAVWKNWENFPRTGPPSTKTT